jgi:hypothetical protein
VARERELGIGGEDAASAPAPAKTKKKGAR